MWLASALMKIENAAHQIPNMDAEHNPATAHLFIVNPLSGHGMDNLFRRIAEKLAEKAAKPLMQATVVLTFCSLAAA